MVDDSLKLSWSKKGFPKSTDYAALSASSGSTFAEDPHKFFLRKVKKLDEPMNIPLAAGSAGHDGTEAFLTECYLEGKDFNEAGRSGLRAAADTLSEMWPEVEDRTVRENPDNPANPRNREEVELTEEDLMGRLEEILWFSFCAIEELNGRYKVFEAQQNPIALEASVGELAKRAGRPHHVIESYDPTRGEYGEMPVAVIGGVPVRGRVDAVVEWPDGGEAIIDHKLVSKVVPYYPTYNSDEWRMYEPSYNPANSLQLDMYAFASNTPRAGFQFMLRRPQYEPDKSPLYSDWIDEPDWDQHPWLLPAAFVDAPDGLRQLCVWRHLPDDHPNATSDFTTESIKKRTIVRVRQLAEAITESLILYDEGVDPKIAFPPGDPEEIAQKACPYCHFGANGTGQCVNPRKDTKTSKQQYAETINQREKACQAEPRIRERREKWDMQTVYNYPHL